MKIIIGQGNPGAQYASSRHNIGFMALDRIAQRSDATFIKKAKFQAEIAECLIAGEKVLLVKPTTFYNETGRSARVLADFYKIDPVTDLLVIHDDLSLPLGMIRIREKGSDAGNNGIKSLNAHLGPDYRRMRIGVYNELRDRMNDADFVLSAFGKIEMESLRSTVLPRIVELSNQFCGDTLQTTSYSLALDT